MKKIFVSALTVLNLLFASAQEVRTDISFTPAGGAAETTTTTSVENKSTESQSAVAAPAQTNPNNVQVAPQQQPAPQQTTTQTAAQQTATQTSTQTAPQQSAAAQPQSSSSSNSDDYDSDFFASNNEASTSGEGQIKNVFGIRVGYSASKIASLGVYSASVSGFTVGATDQIWFGERNVFAETGVFFVQKGYELKDFEPSKTKLNYIEIPALICHRIGRESLNITAKAGGYIACGVKGKLNTYISESPAASDFFLTEHEFDVFKEGAISRFDAGARFGLAFVIRKVLLGCRYDLGLYKIDKNDLIYGDDELMLGYKHLKTRSFQILMGINFNH